MSKMKDRRKQMKKEQKAFAAQIETFGARADDIEVAAVKRAQERLVNLVDAMSAQLKVWQNTMVDVSPKRNGNKTTASILNLGVAANLDQPSDKSSAALTMGSSMEQQIQQWLTTTATIRMEVGADAQWQLETLRALHTTADEKLRALKNAQNGEQAALQMTAEEALADLKHALKHISPV